MEIRHSGQSRRDLQDLPIDIQNKFEKQIQFLLSNFRHPSLQAKKYGGFKNVFQARVDQHYRFYFRIETDRYVLLSIGPHPK